MSIFVVLTLSILSENVTNSHIEQKNLAVRKCDKNYENLDKACGLLFREIEEIRNSGEISVAGNVFKVELFLGGDVKFLQLIMGLSGIMSNYACIWCKVHKSDRGNISLPWDFYHREEQKRTVSNISEHSRNGTCSVKNKP